MVGHYIGYIGNAAVGASLQIFILVIVFVSSVFTGMSVLVARCAGSGDSDSVNRSVYQALLVTLLLAFGVLTPFGYMASTTLLAMIKAAPEDQAEAVPFIRIMSCRASGCCCSSCSAGALARPPVTPRRRCVSAS